MTEHQGLPVKGYAPTQSQTNVDLVNESKQLEERVLRFLDSLEGLAGSNRTARWLSVGRTHIEQGFMAANRSIFNPQRIKLPEDT